MDGGHTWAQAVLCVVWSFIGTLHWCHERCTFKITVGHLKRKEKSTTRKIREPFWQIMTLKGLPTSNKAKLFGIQILRNIFPHIVLWLYRSTAVRFFFSFLFISRAQKLSPVPFDIIQIRKKIIARFWSIFIATRWRLSWVWSRDICQESPTGYFDVNFSRRF